MRTNVHIHGQEPANHRARVVIHPEQDNLDHRTNVRVDGQEGPVRDLGDAMKTKVQIHGGQPRREAGPYQGRDALNTRVVLEPPNVTLPKVIGVTPGQGPTLTPTQAIEVLQEQLQSATEAAKDQSMRIEQITAALAEAKAHVLGNTTPAPPAEPPAEPPPVPRRTVIDMGAEELVARDSSPETDGPPTLVDEQARPDHAEDFEEPG